MWNLSPEQRLATWKSVRKDISNLPAKEAAQKVAELWVNAPFTPHPVDSLDVNFPKLWPSAWDLIIQSHFCELGRVLGMLYTLQYSGNPNIFSLSIKQGVDNEMINYTLLLINDEHVLNFRDGGITDIDEIKFKTTNIYEQTF